MDNIRESIYAKFNCSIRTFSMGGKCCSVCLGCKIWYRALRGRCGMVGRQYCLSFLEQASFVLPIVSNFLLQQQQLFNSSSPIKVFYCLNYPWVRAVMSDNGRLLGWLNGNHCTSLVKRARGPRRNHP